jgi:hypothetical protein
MIGVAIGHDGPELMAHDLLVGFLLPSLEDLVVEELFGVLISCGDVEDQFGIYHYCSEHKHARILLCEIDPDWQN